jgi:hypothetical protein
MIIANGYYGRICNIVVTEELGTKWLQKNLEQNGYRRTCDKMATEELATKWLQKNLKQND